MTLSVEDYQNILEDGAVFDGGTFYVNDEESAHNLVMAFEGRYQVKRLSQDEISKEFEGRIGLKVSKLEKVGATR
jgi:hypothetical protein